MRNKMLADGQKVNDYNFVEREKKLSIEALKMCITEEVGFYKEHGESARLDYDLGVISGVEVLQDEYEKLLKRFETELL
jgi:hypothetical protein